MHGWSPVHRDDAFALGASFLDDDFYVPQTLDDFPYRAWLDIGRLGPYSVSVVRVIGSVSRLIQVKVWPIV